MKTQTTLKSLNYGMNLKNILKSYEIVKTEIDTDKNIVHFVLKNNKKTVDIYEKVQAIRNYENETVLVYSSSEHLKLELNPKTTAYTSIILEENEEEHNKENACHSLSELNEKEYQEKALEYAKKLNKFTEPFRFDPEKAWQGFNIYGSNKNMSDYIKEYLKEDGYSWSDKTFHLLNELTVGYYYCAAL